MKLQKVKNRSVLFTFHTESGWDLNLHLIRGKVHNFIIDTGLGSLCIAPILEYIGQDAKPIIVVNTHHHWDHVWGNSAMMGRTILSHKLCREMITSKWEVMLLKNSHYQCGEAKIHLPNLTFEEELYFPEDKIRVLYTPGHTIDSISILDEEEGVLNAGDNVGDTLDEIIPSLDCSKELYLETLLKYRQLDFDTLLSGHNVILGKDIIGEIENHVNAKILEE